MKNSDVVIIGGSAAGVSAAISARRHNKDASITLIRKEETVMIPCGIPYIYDTLGSTDKNILPDTLLSGNNVDLIIGEVASVDKDSRTVTMVDGETIGYGKLILAIGSSPIRPKIPGTELNNVFAVWKDVSALTGIKEALSRAKDVVIIGGGFIGVEMADECKKMTGGNVSIIEILPHCLMLALDEEFCEAVDAKLDESGIQVKTGIMATSILGNKKVEAVELQNGEKIKADVVIMGIGSTPNVELASQMGLKISETGAVLVDEYMKTSDGNIFACGDCAQKYSYFNASPSNLRLASIATYEARIAGTNVYGLKQKNPGIIGVFSSIIGDFAVSSTGLTEKAAGEAGIDVVTVEAAAPDKHPGSMPQTKPLRVKLIFDKIKKTLIGGEVSGGATTAEVANIIAIAIQNKMTADGLAMSQVGTHPALTCSPIAYQINNAAEQAAIKLA